MPKILECIKSQDADIVALCGLNDNALFYFTTKLVSMDYSFVKGAYTPGQNPKSLIPLDCLQKHWTQKHYVFWVTDHQPLKGIYFFALYVFTKVDQKNKQG